MAFATDRDVLVVEPGVFREAAWVGQRVLTGTGSVSGSSLTLDPGGVSLADAGIGAGSVVLIGGVAAEVVERTGALTATVSKVRADVALSALPLVAQSGASVEAYTFGPQLAMVHRRVLRMLGVEPDAMAGEGVVVESDIVNADELGLLEVLGALHLIYVGVAAAGPAGQQAEKKAQWYRDRFEAERRRAAARIDLDGDGRADATRRPGVGRLVRG